MNLTDLLLMRQELMLVLLALVVVIVDLAIEDKRKAVIIGITLVLFSIITVVGFLPSKEGNLFGGMYNTTHLIVAMKNVLNVALLIILSQSVKWVRNEEQ
jgi:NADH-quinone oxidoreductase subunit N